MLPRGQHVRCVAVFPDRMAAGEPRVFAQRRLRKPAAEKTSKHVAAAALSELWIAGGVHEQLAVSTADE